MGLNVRFVFRLLLFLVLMPVGGGALCAQSMAVLQQRIETAGAGSIITLESGVYTGNLVIDKPISIESNGHAILDGQGIGDVVRITAPGVSLQGMVIRHSGMNLTQMNAGVFVERSASRVRIEGNRFENNAFGVWLDACESPEVVENHIIGTPEVRSQDRGNGIHLYSVKNGLIRGNVITETRDGIYIDSSSQNRLQGNLMHHLRYGVHYMYAYNNEVVDNTTRNTRTGYALMQSKYLTVTGNLSDSDDNYGILMNFITHSEIAGNTVINTRKGRAFVTGGDDVAGAEGKALFVYNSQFNKIHDNRFDHADIGIHLTAGSEDNRLYANAFMNNRIQVKYVATRDQEWSWDGRGNYWSDYLGWDINADGIGDKPYEPNDAVDKVLWKYPVARVLMSSPTIDTLRWVQRQFPVFRPKGVRDSFPLMMNPRARISGPAGELAHSNE